MKDELAALELHALLGAGTEFEGKLVHRGKVRIDGNFKGTIHCDDILIIGDGALIDAEIHAPTVVILGGVVRGSINATQAIELYVPSEVHADLITPDVYFDKGVIFSGQLSKVPN